MPAATLILRGIVLGLGAAAPIGPVNVEIARRTLRGGFWRGFALGCGAVSVDVTYAILSAFSLHRVMTRPRVELPLSVAGIVFLFYLAFLSVRGAARNWGSDAPAPPAPGGSCHGAYLTGVLMTLLNPMTLGFWFLAVPAALGATTTRPAADLPMICAGVFAGTLAWVVTFAGLLSRGAGRLRNNRPLAVADLVGGAVLFCFAAAQVWRVSRAVL